MKLHFASTLFAATAVVGGLHAGGLTAHEWGTFTSVQGSDGTVLAWNPLASSELPKFVHNRVNPLGGPARGVVSLDDLKTIQRWTERLETPVIYFYGNTTTKVSVEARFPSGLITEWYPQLNSFGPSFGLTNLVAPTKASFARWDDLELIPAQDSKLVKFPSDGSANHYYAARETQALSLRANSLLSRGGQPEVEKFIFYRGAGNFDPPLRVSQTDNSSIQLSNTSEQSLHSLYILNIKGREAKFASIDEIQVNSSRVVDFEIDADLKPLDETMDKLRARMEESLTQAGLYREEAHAMVKTWSDSWFAESGVRILYLLPSQWTETILPLSIKPTPDETVRVMVGRAEVLTRATEKRLEEIYTSIRTPEEIPSALETLESLHLGRFTEAALARLEEVEHAKTSDRIRELRNSINARPLARN